MRGIHTLPLLAMLAAACDEPGMPAAVVKAEAPPAPMPPVAAAVDVLDAAAQRALQHGDPAAIQRLQQSPGMAVRALLLAVDQGNVVAQGRAPLLLAQLGSDALPELDFALRDASPTRRRIAALACLQLGTSARPLANALLSARDDADVAVRAVAELAWQAAVGDRSDLYRLRAEHDAALQPR